MPGVVTTPAIGKITYDRGMCIGGLSQNLSGMYFDIFFFHDLEGIIWACPFPILLSPII
jgi:hypothetical protein